VTVVPLTDNAIAFVLWRLWERGVHELAALGLTKGEAFLRFRDFARAAWHPQALEFDGEPVVVTGINTDENGAFTWFQATEKFAAHALEITRHIRKEAAAYPGPVSIFSVCVHPDSARWFRALGFVRDDDFSQALPSGALLLKFDRR
jgi:hypothetical protein